MAALKFNPKLADTLDLDRLKAGMVGMTPAVGAFYAEAASVCLEQEDHHPGVQMQVDGDCHHRLRVKWTTSDDTDQRSRTWNDSPVATEHGAYGVAALLIDGLTEYTVVERSRKGTGFDYWLGKKNADPDSLLFQEKARLEVSGIRKGDSRLSSRTRQKTEQMKPSDGTRLPGVAVVVEFGLPRTRVRTK